MQFSSWKSTIPLAYCTIAPGEGQAFRHPGSAQCMQPSLRMSHSRSPLGFSTSAKRISVQLLALRSWGFWYCPVVVPISSRRSFHSMQATWHALQPMHLVVSMSLATPPPAGAWRICGERVVVAERRTMSRDCNAMAVRPLSLLDLDQERFELGCLRVAIAHHRGKRVRQVPRLGEAFEAPVNGDADVVQRLALDLEHLQALGDHGDGLDVAAVGADLYRIPARDAQLLAECGADLYKLLGLDDGVQAHVLGPVMEVLGEAIGGRRVRKLRGVAESLAIIREHPCRGVAERAWLVGAQRVLRQRRFEGLVMLGEGALGHVLPGEEARHAFRIHDEGTHAVGRVLVGLEVRDVSAAPGRAVPGHQRPGAVEGLAVKIARGAVVEHAAVGGPRERPVDRLADAGRIGVVAPCHQVAARAPGTAEDPATARGRAVV